MFIHVFPVGLAYVAAALRKAGHKVEIYNQDMHHYPDSHLTAHLDRGRYDVVGVGVIGGYYQYRKLLRIAEAVNASKRRPFFILGGHGPSPEPEYFLRKTRADAAVIGEGEETIVELLAALGGHRSLASVRSIAYLEGGKVRLTPRREPIRDLDSIPRPAYDLFPMEYYRLLREPHARNSEFVLSVLSGRGCTFRCAFCYRMDKGFRPRSAESIIEEIRFLKTDYGINYVDFADELLMSSIGRTMALCEAFLSAGLDFRWGCEGRLNFARPELLNLMKRAGCVFINYGIEALDDTVLRSMNKCLTVAQIIRGIEATLAAGISPGYNVIFGNIGDNRKTLRKGVEFLVKYDDGSQLRTIRPVTPYPGSALYYLALKKGLLKDCADFYENKHVNSDLLAVNFTDLSDDDFHGALFEANKRLLENYFRKKSRAAVAEARSLYFERDVSFRGFRQT
ncbi:MAG: radical SAM protein [Elusimicrobiota bacterium]